MAILNNINSSSPRAWDIFPFLCIIFSFLHQCFYSFQTLYFTSLIKFILWYFILFDLWLSWNSHISSVQSRPTLCNPMDCSLPGSSIHGIFQARVLEWVAISFSRGSSWPMDRTWVSCIAGRRFTIWATREARFTYTDL